MSAATGRGIHRQRNGTIDPMNNLTTAKTATSRQESTLSAWLWPRMSDLYGYSWTRDRGESDERGTWTSALGKHHPTQIQHALADCLRVYPDRPPTLGQFRVLCKMHPDPRAPLQLPPKQKSENSAQWIADLKAMMEAAKDAGPMTDDQRGYHMRVLGMDIEPTSAQVTPGSEMACSYMGCVCLGTMTHSDGGRWYCRRHFSIG